MIHVVVGTSHLNAILGYRRGHRFNDVLRSTLEPIAGQPILTVASPAELSKTTVFEVLRDFHNRVASLLKRGGAEILAAQRDDILRVAHQEYYRPNFECTPDDACRSLAIHGVFPHGTLRQDTGPVPAYLPDFSLGVRYFGYFGRPISTFIDGSDHEEMTAFLAYVGSLRSSSDVEVETASDWLEGLLHDIGLSLVTHNHEAYVAVESLSDRIGEMPLEDVLHRLRDLVPLVEAGLRNIERFARQKVDRTIEGLWANRSGHDLSELECHLCDDLATVHNRSDAYWQRRLPKEDGPDRCWFLMDHARKEGEEYLVLDALANGFQGLRSLRRDNPEVPALANHRLLAATATRQGLGKPVVSGILPIELWRRFEEPVQHFVLEAAEHVGKGLCPTLYPNMPSLREMQHLHFAAARAEEDCGFEVGPYENSLRKLGMESAVQRRIDQYLARLEEGQWAWDWTRAISELRSALYEEDIEQSLHLQEILDLYPLHKRILGLVEHVFVPSLKSRNFSGAASTLWTNAFCGQRADPRRDIPQVDRLCSAATWPRGADLRATLETEGNWLILAADRSLGEGNPLDLANLLDGLMSRICTASEVRGVRVNLKPATPQEQARYSTVLANRQNSQAACMTLYLGKIALMLRNAIEHGSDRVTSMGLLVEFPGYWSEIRDKRRREVVFDWDNRVARELNWPSKSAMPTKLPPRANEFLLTSASLHRCLVLLSLVLRAGLSHLGL